jgi:hypothetical protein
VHATSGAGVIPKLTDPAVGLRLTSPLHPVTRSERTFSIRTSLQSRLDYILPNGLLYSNIVASQTFRTGVLNPLPSALLVDDDRTASDHLPVLMIFESPYTISFQITEIAVEGNFLSLRWEAIPGRRYAIEWSPDLEDWQPAAAGILASAPIGLWQTARPSDPRYYRLWLEPAL